MNDDPLFRWLLEGTDPSVRYRVLRELLDRPEDDPDVVSARAEIGTTGWAASLLGLQFPDGRWSTPGSTARELYVPKYIATNWRLLVLADLGLTRTHPSVARGAQLLLDAEGVPEGGLGGTSSEVCFTGNCVRMFRQFGYGDDPRVRASTEWLLATQKKDGGWHCSKKSNTGTLDCWEALAAFATFPRTARSPELQRSIERGAEFYLERALVQEGPFPYAPWSRTHYPVHYYYDVLVGLDVLSRLGYGNDPRLGPALNWLLERRNRDGSWNLDALHPDLPPDEKYQVETPYYPFVLEPPGRPSRWVTLTALTVLRRSGRTP
jgi:Prenyltransferase and squalene oxidase repeat